jgi:hypothetical protein
MKQVQVPSQAEEVDLSLLRRGYEFISYPTERLWSRFSRTQKGPRESLVEVSDIKFHVFGCANVSSRSGVESLRSVEAYSGLSIRELMSSSIGRN